MFLRLLTAWVLVLILAAAPRGVAAQVPAGFSDGIRLLDVWATTTVAQRGQPGPDRQAASMPTIENFLLRTGSP